MLKWYGVLESVRRRRSESGVSTTIEVIIFTPLAIMLVGFILNAAFHWTTSFYMQGVVNDGAAYTAAAGGDVRIPYVPNGGFDLKPSEYIVKQAATSKFVNGPVSVKCGMEAGLSSVNGISACVVTYRTLVFPTDPFTARYFGQNITLVSEDVAQTAYNPNLSPGG